MIYYCICTCSHDIKNETCSHPYEYINFDRCIHGFQHVFSVSTCPPAKMCAVCINLYWCIYIFKDTPACIYTYIYIHIIQVIHLHNFTHTTCRKSTPFHVWSDTSICWPWCRWCSLVPCEHKQWHSEPLNLAQSASTFLKLPQYVPWSSSWLVLGFNWLVSIHLYSSTFRMVRLWSQLNLCPQVAVSD